MTIEYCNATHQNAGPCLSPCAQVKSEYAQLKETLGAVTQERDLALWERNQLQAKLENLEQVLKVRKLAPRTDAVCQYCVHFHF